MGQDAAKTAGRHIVGLDFIRFAAALAVVYFHYAAVSWSSPSPATAIAGFGPFLSPLWPTAWIGFVGVQVFFVISGFVIAYSAESASPFTFLRDRIGRLAPALWIGACLDLLVYLAFHIGAPADALKLFAKQITLFPISPWLNVVVWTLGVEITFYALVFALLCLNRFRWIMGLAALITLASLAFLAHAVSIGCPFVSDGTWCPVRGRGLNRLTELLLLQHGCFFALGVFLWSWLVKGKRAGHEWWAGLALVGCFINITLMSLVQRPQAWFAPDAFPMILSYLSANLVWILSILALIAFVRWNDAVTRAIGPHGVGTARILGLATYPLYLLHLVVGVGFIGVLTRLGVQPLWAILGGAVLVFGLSVFVAAVMEPPARRAIRAVMNSLGAGRARTPAPSSRA